MNDYGKLERLAPMNKPHMHPNTKRWLDGVLAAWAWPTDISLLKGWSGSPQGVAAVLALLIDEDVGRDLPKPITRAEELAIAAELRSGAADEYIAGLLGYV